MLSAFLLPATFAAYASLHNVQADAVELCRELGPRPDLVAFRSFPWTADFFLVTGNQLQCAVVAPTPGPIEFSGVSASIELVRYHLEGGEWAVREREFLAPGDYPDWVQPDGSGFQPNRSEPSRWSVSAENDPLTDTINVHARNRSHGRVQLEFGQSVVPELTIACYQNSTQVYVRFPERFIGNDSMEVRFRLDGGRVESGLWQISSNSRSVGFFSGRQAIPMVRRLSAADELVVNLTPYNESNWTLVFDLSGVEAVARQVRAACSW